MPYFPVNDSPQINRNHGSQSVLSFFASPFFLLARSSSHSRPITAYDDDDGICVCHHLSHPSLPRPANQYTNEYLSRNITRLLSHAHLFGTRVLRRAAVETTLDRMILSLSRATSNITNASSLSPGRPSRIPL